MFSVENGEKVELTPEDLGEIRIARPGDLIKGKVVKKGEENYFVNINSKSEGLLPLREKMVGKEEVVENQLEEGDEAWVVVTNIDEQGYVWLSREQALYQGAWIDIEEIQIQNKTLTAKVKKRVKGGLIVDVGVNAFLPASCVDIAPKNLDEFIDKTISVKIIEADRKAKNVVVSRKAVLEEEKERQKKELFDSLEIGQIRTGTVRNITDFGVFIDLGGVDGLLHISEVSWRKTNDDLEELFHRGEEIEVKVIAFDPEKEEISLSLKRLQPDPWEDIEERIRPGDIVKGKVVSLRDFGVFVEIEEGLEGLIRISDLSWGYVRHPQEVVQVGSIVESRVLEVDKDKRRISLGIKQVLPDPWEDIEERYHVDSTVKVRISSITHRGVWGEIEEGVEGRIPLEELSWKRVTRPSEIVRRNQVVEAKIVKIDAESRQIILSIRQLRPNPWEDIAGKWEIGDIVEAKVQRLMSFGAFVELAPEIEGLLPLSEIDWGPVKHPNQFLKKGQVLPLKIIELNPEEKRIVVSRKATLPDPWEEIKSKYPVGSIHSRKIVKLVDFGAFVELEKGWDGLVHISEISDQRISSPSLVLKEGQEVKVKVIKIDDQEKKIGLSIKQASQEEEKEHASSDGRITLGDMVGSKLTDLLNSLKK